MKTLLALFALIIAAAHAQNRVRQCKPYEIVFLLDHSENARKASTEGDNATGPRFQLLKNAWETYMSELDAAGRNLFKIWAFAYSSRANPLELVQRNTPPNQARNPQIGVIQSGGSWTYKGLEQLRNQRPTMANNIVIIISAQGSANAQRQRQALQEYQALRSLGWNTYVIGVMSGTTIDRQELQSVDSDGQIVIVDDGKPTNKKSYRNLGAALTTITNTYLCPTIIVTPRPTLPPTVPSTGICSNCKINAGNPFDRHRKFCDSFYQCLPDGSYILKHCSQSLVWNDQISTCVRTSEFTCPTGACSAAFNGRLYPSGVCCNMYFMCDGTNLLYKKCPTGQIFDEGRRGCVASNDPIGDCKARGGFFCNERVNTQTGNCGMFSAEETGNPCKYYHTNVLSIVAQGTMWDQQKCALVHSDLCKNGVFSTRSLKDISDVCSAILISSFDQGRPAVQSERDPTLPLYVSLTNANVINGALIFRPGVTDARAYYYFFNTNEIPNNSAFRIRFQLDNSAQIGVVYDLFSNNYCADCPETMAATVRKTSQTSYTVSCKFVDSVTNAIVQTDTVINGGGQWIELIAVWGTTDIHGVVKTVAQGGGTSSNQVQIQSTRKQGNIKPNKCGILLGAGPNTNFIGRIDMFAYYTNCARIDDLLSRA